jgi:hypothetical protein
MSWKGGITCIDFGRTDKCGITFITTPKVNRFESSERILVNFKLALVSRASPVVYLKFCLNRISKGWSPLFLFPVKIYKYVKREKLSTKMIVAIAGNFPAISWQQEVVFP